MKKEKRRPSLEELKEMPRDGLDMELAFVAEVARQVGLPDVEKQAVDLLQSGTVSAADVVWVRELLQPVAKEAQV